MDSINTTTDTIETLVVAAAGPTPAITAEEVRFVLACDKLCDQPVGICLFYVCTLLDGLPAVPPCSESAQPAPRFLHTNTKTNVQPKEQASKVEIPASEASSVAAVVRYVYIYWLWLGQSDVYVCACVPSAAGY